MTSNDKIILDEILKARQADVDPDADASDYFELFTAEQILKDYDLSYDEIESGLIGDGGDGGIDSIYLFVNGELVREDPDYAHLKKNPSIDLVVIQSKTAAGFQETPVERFLTVSDDIFDLSKPVATFDSVYNEGLLEAISRFRTLHQQLAPNTLQLAENPVSSAGQIGFLCLVKLRDFYAFITDDDGALHPNIFEANVRDYQGRTEVNDEVAQQRSFNPCLKRTLRTTSANF